MNAVGTKYPNPDRPVGPTITGVIDCRDEHNVLDGFVIEEGVIPLALAPVTQLMMGLLPEKTPPPQKDFTSMFRNKLSGIGKLMSGPHIQRESLERTQTYLVMSHDSNQGSLSLRNDKPNLKYSVNGRTEHVNYLGELLTKATNAVGGTHVNTPFRQTFGQQEVSIYFKLTQSRSNYF